ncbi:class I SAM-dependent methyltransferase [Cytobacillus dafuensis]|uniref:Class I SAM-dependent methyltransferase n=1 Tax=Cytobacillus dafuensis TaxID=1742359 RepID=A0A5B8Z141_CYTDA|nr:class I SAM-dependent methyltransferase [Cytobacillus dafuensis]QED46531.1 class I SAM-dependent methyltransferase [Cytobacillus dafuensis]
MEYKGSSAYDQDRFFEQYIARRYREESPNERIEKPVLFELLDDVTDYEILDLGCGDASLGLELLKRQCRSYTGVDGSKNMCERASEHLKDRRRRIVHSTMEEYSFPLLTYDLVVSQLAIHYIEDFSTLTNKIYETLKVNDQFAFSVQHPLLTSSFESLTASGKRNNWIVDNYFHSGKRVEPWIGENVVKYHRTIEEYFSILKRNGFIIDDLREAAPQKDHFKDIEEYERRMRIPLFLLFSCRKPC